MVSRLFGPWTQPGLALGLGLMLAGYFVQPLIWLCFFVALIGLNSKNPTTTQLCCGVVLSFAIPAIGIAIYSP